ncbi:uncharacterized protein LOC126833109 isoform X2 [Adelges cooleyi]|uniref:uncharacterized protein LOC126833109 isoform X2 n=1 Tax=Adelges cooleyi TaxID=133065 RepID=UPI00217F67FE|nr:uncharacterized protein LOC126833109 isoform X2 [Adelges cooleyi]
MSIVENLSQDNEDKDISSKAYKKNNEYLSTPDFDKFKDACQKTGTFPDALLKDMDKMYDTCIRSQNVSNELSNLIKEGIENIRPEKKSFDYLAKVYNKLLQLWNNDSSSSTTNNCVSNTSKNENQDVGMIPSNGNCYISHKLFDELIEKCYDNVKFPKSNIDTIKTLFKSIPSDFTESKLFIKLLREANQSVWPDSSAESYVHLENIYDQLRQFKSAKRIARIKIKKIDETEMSISNSDDFDNNSPYILKDRYERRAVEIYKRLCKLTKNPVFLEQPLIRFKGTDNTLVNKTIEKYYNTQKEFPDYNEVYELLERLNKKKKLNWSENKLSNISRDAFLKLGKQLKLIRVNDYMSRISEMITEKDPAEENEELKKKLEESNKKMDLSMNKLAKEFELKQNKKEETNCSSRGNTECENSSSDEELNDKPEKKTISFYKTKNIETKRKQSPNFSNSEETHSKCSKKLKVASIDLKPCEKKSDKYVLQNLKTISENEKTEVDMKETDNSKNNDIKNKQKQLKNSFVEIGATEEKNVGLKNNNNCTDVQTISDESVGDPIINESEVVPQELLKNEDKVIEIIEHDGSGSDLEMTVCDMPNLPVIHKRSQMDTKNKSNFNKKNNWHGNVQNEVKNGMPKMSRSPQIYRSVNNTQIPSNSKEGNVYNQWLKHTGAVPQSGLSTKCLSPRVGLPYSRPVTFHTNMQQRQVKQHIVQQQHHKGYNQVTRMTTTTTVVEQSAHQISYRLPTPHMHRARHVLPRNRQINKSPELIELD